MTSAGKHVFGEMWTNQLHAERHPRRVEAPHPAALGEQPQPQAVSADSAASSVAAMPISLMRVFLV